MYLEAREIACVRGCGWKGEQMYWNNRTSVINSEISFVIKMQFKPFAYSYAAEMTYQII